MAQELALAESVLVHRSADLLYALVSDVTRMPEWSPEVVACVWDPGESPRVGASFTGHNELPGRAWQTRCTVFAADPGREFGFHVNGSRVRWHYAFEPLTASSTRVTESWTFLPDGLAYFHDKHGADAERRIRERTQRAREGIHRALGALKRVAEAT